MDVIEKEIRDCFERMGHELASPVAFTNGAQWSSNSQYGYELAKYSSREEAEAATVAYYRERMNLIRQ